MNLVCRHWEGRVHHQQGREFKPDPKVTLQVSLTFSHKHNEFGSCSLLSLFPVFQMIFSSQHPSCLEGQSSDEFSRKKPVSMFLCLHSTLHMHINNRAGGHIHSSNQGRISVQRIKAAFGLHLFTLS